MDPKRRASLLAHLRHLRSLIDARVHSVAWRSFRPQPWQQAIGNGSHSDPTYAVVEFLENDSVYQELKAKYRETKRELEDALREAVVCGTCGLTVAESEQGQCVRCSR